MRTESVCCKYNTLTYTHPFSLFFLGLTDENRYSKASCLLADLRFEMCDWFQFEKFKVLPCDLSVIGLKLPVGAKESEQESEGEFWVKRGEQSR